MTNLIRVKSFHGEEMAQALRDAGFEAIWQGPGTALTSYGNGCSDPECCTPHQCYWDPQGWGTVATNASGKKAHKVWLSLGLVEKK